MDAKKLEELILPAVTRTASCTVTVSPQMGDEPTLWGAEIPKSTSYLQRSL